MSIKRVGGITFIKFLGFGLSFYRSAKKVSKLTRSVDEMGRVTYAFRRLAKSPKH
jgi:hypothetical protein